MSGHKKAHTAYNNGVCGTANFRMSVCESSGAVERAPRRGDHCRRDEEDSMAAPEACRARQFTDWTTGNHLRHSEFVALRDDKNAREVVKENW